MIFVVGKFELCAFNTDTIISVKVDFHCRVIFTCARLVSKIEQCNYGRSRVNVKVEPRSTLKWICT